MSYILDALRKSDQQRQRGAAPTLLSAHASAVAPRQTALFFYALLSLMLVGAGVAIGWLRPWQAEHAAPVALLPAKPFEPAPIRALPVPAEVEVKPQAQARLPRAAPVAPHQAAAAASGKTVESIPERGVSKDAAAVTPAQTTIPLAELPVSLQQELPPMSISVHAYSGRPADRLIGINGKLLREGDEVAPGLRLEEITPDGMILSYKEYRFRRGVR